MRVLGVVYLAAGAGFFFFPAETFYLINVGPKVFKMFQDVPESTERFWLVLTFSMMMMLSFIAFYSSFQPKNYALALVHLLSKLISTLGFVYVFFNSAPLFAYIVGAATDGTIFLVVLVATIRVMAAGSEKMVEEPTVETNTPHA